MNRSRPIIGIDVGTSKVATVVGQIQEGIIHIVSVAKVQNTGVRKGMVIEAEEVVSAISNALGEAERIAGTPLSLAFVGVEGVGINSVDAKGVVAVSRADGEITDSDVERVLEASKTAALPANHEILHVIPKNFTIDGQGEIKDPIGTTGIRLEVDSHIIGVSTTTLRNLTKSIYQAGLQIEGMIFSPLAASKALLTKKQKETGVILIDMGAGTTSMVVFEEGDIISSKVIPIGSNHITNDIAIGLRTNLDVAERIKAEFVTNFQKAREGEKLDLAKIQSGEEGRFSKKYLVEIVDARLKEIFGLVRSELKRIHKDGMLPAGAVLTGGGAQLTGLVDFVKDYLKLPAQVGKPVLELSGMVDKLDDPIYTASVGLMLWGIEIEAQEEGPTGRFGIDLKGLNFEKIINKTKNIFKQFLP